MALSGTPKDGRSCRNLALTDLGYTDFQRLTQQYDSFPGLVVEGVEAQGCGFVDKMAHRVCNPYSCPHFRSVHVAGVLCLFLMSGNACDAGY